MSPTPGNTNGIVPSIPLDGGDVLDLVVGDQRLAPSSGGSRCHSDRGEASVAA